MTISKLVCHIVAHDDDWMLFCGDKAYSDLTDPEVKSVFIVVCSGDGRYGDEDIDSRIKWSQAREYGMVNTLNAIKGTNQSANTLDDHGIAKYTFDPENGACTVAYFLRLPDGACRVQCQLENLKDNPRYPDADLAVDNIYQIKDPSLGNKSYKKWDDLVTVLREIIINESDNCGSRQICAPDCDWRDGGNNEENGEGFPYKDHEDHLCVAHAVQDCMKDEKLHSLEQYLWIGYPTSLKYGKPENASRPPYSIDPNKGTYGSKLFIRGLADYLGQPIVPPDFYAKALIYWQWATSTDKKEKELFKEKYSAYLYYSDIWNRWGKYSGVSKIIPGVSQ